MIWGFLVTKELVLGCSSRSGAGSPIPHQNPGGDQKLPQESPPGDREVSGGWLRASHQLPTLSCSGGIKAFCLCCVLIPVAVLTNYHKLGSLNKKFVLETRGLKWVSLG